MAPKLTRRAIGAFSRRLGRPELVSAFDAAARRDEHDQLATRAVLAATLGPGAFFVDVGSNRGQVLAEAVRLTPQGRQLAFEPIPALAAELRAAFPLSQVTQKALGAKSGKARFCHFRRLDGWSGLRRNPAISDEEGAPEYIEVEVSTLDEELAGELPHVIKIDVEGAELAVLEGARGTLEHARPLLIFEHVEETSALYGEAPGALWDLLHDAGYRITSATGLGPFERESFLAAPGVVNWLARPER